MASNQAAKQIARAIKEADNKKTRSYDTAAVVKRIEGSTIWVSIPGGIDETPVQRTINASVGDKVQVRVAGGRAWVTGNASNPPTDDTVAYRAEQKAGFATKEAARAAIAADQAERSAEEAKISAENARNSAVQANTHANSALTQLSVVEQVVDTLQWITDHGTYLPAEPIYVLTTDTQINPDTQYYTRTGEEPDYIYTPVEEPVEEDLPEYYVQALDPKEVYFIIDGQGMFTPVAEPSIDNIGSYYQLEINEAVTNFVSTHLSVTNGVYRQTMDTYPKNYKAYFTRSGTDPDYIYTYVPNQNIPADYHLTRDTVINSYKTYYTRSGTAPDYVYTIVTHPVTEDLGSYYEAYDMTIYYEYQPGGLWVLLNDDSYKVLIANDGFYLYDDTGRMITSLGSNLILDSDKPQFIGGEEAYIVYYDGNGDGIPDSIKIGGKNIEIGGDTPLSQVIAGVSMIARNTLIYDHSYTPISGGSAVRFTAYLYRGGVDVKTAYASSQFTWYYKTEDETSHYLGSGYTIDVPLSITGYGVHIIGRFTKEDEAELLDDDGDNLATNDNENLITSGTGNAVKVRNLQKTTTVDPADYVMVVTPEKEKIAQVTNLADAVWAALNITIEGQPLCAGDNDYEDIGLLSITNSELQEILVI